MAKIKFNLNFGGEQIRTLDDLRDNFSIEDVLDVYNNSLLVKWLDVHNHKDELEQVNAIHATDARGILSELIRIFGVTSDPSEIEESLSVLDYLEERKKFWADIKAGKFDEIARNITKSQNEEETHHASKKTYDELVQEIIDNHQDLNHIYDCLDAITADYPDILKEKYSELFNRLYESRPHTIIPLFAHHGTRPYYTLDENKLRCETFKIYYSITEEEEILVFNSDSMGLYANDFRERPAALSEKIHFLRTLHELMPVLLSESEKYPYIKIAETKIFGDKWTVVEKPDKRFMPIYVKYSMRFAHFLFTGTYHHNKIFGVTREKTQTDCVPLFLPVIEGIDVCSTSGDNRSVDISLAYVEAR